MRKIIFTQFRLLVLILMLTACGPVVARNVPILATETQMPTEAPASLPTATIPPEPTQAQHSFPAAVYKDETNNFQLDYPSDWTLVPNTVIGSRASSAQLFSPGSTAEKLLDGGTRLGITVYQWDPKGDLEAYVNHRKSAWESDGHSIISESSGNLADGRKQKSFTVSGPDKAQAFFMVTTVGENYLEIAGDGNLALIEEIAQTLRALNPKP